MVQTAWNGIMGALQAVGDWINSVFGPSFRTFQALVTAVFQAIQILVMAWWKLWMVPILEGVQALLITLGGWFTWLYNNAVKPAFDFIVAIIKTQWAAMSAIFDLVVAGLKIVGGWFVQLYENFVKPQMDAVGAIVKLVWNNVVQPQFELFKAGLGLLGKAFEGAVSAIKTAWNMIQEIVKAPIRFVIETVLNGGLIKGFNWLSDKVGGPHIDNIPMPFATGGVLPGYSPGKDIHKFWSPTGGSLALSGGEAIMRPEFTKAMGGKAGIAKLNKLAMAGLLGSGSKKGNFASGGVHSFAGGGVIDWITSQASSAFSWVGDTASAIWKAFQDPAAYLKGLMPAVTSGGVMGQLATSAGSKVLEAVVTKVKALFTDFQAAYATTGGPVFAKMKEWVMAHLGLPYQWGANGPGAFDCSSFTQQASAAGGVSIPRTSEAQQAAARAIASAALKPGDLGFFGNPAHHVILNMGGGQWAQAPHTGAFTNIGPSSPDSFGATFARGGVFRPLVMDRGGVLPKGLSMVDNRTGSAEELRPPGGNMSVTIELNVDDLAKLHTLDDFLKMLDNARTAARKTQRSGKVNA
jgi:cell wall-associated NlpC family hydrolase